jgi:hypothetical protein
MEPMGDLKKVVHEIRRKLERGELPMWNDAQAPARPPADSMRTIQSSSRPSPVSFGSPERRRAVKTLILRYRDEKKLDDLSNDELRDEVTTTFSTSTTTESPLSESLNSTSRQWLATDSISSASTTF